MLSINFQHRIVAAGQTGRQTTRSTTRYLRACADNTGPAHLLRYDELISLPLKAPLCPVMHSFHFINADDCHPADDRFDSSRAFLPRLLFCSFCYCCGREEGWIHLLSVFSDGAERWMLK